MTSDDEVPSITLGGQRYKVLPVAFREVSKILPLVVDVMPKIRDGDRGEQTLLDLGRIIFYGIKRGETISFEEFIDRPATIEEMIAASLVVCDQAGLKPKDPSQGEATGAGSPQI